MLPSPGQLYIRILNLTNSVHEFNDVEWRRLTLTAGQKKKPVIKTKKARGSDDTEWNEEYVVVIPKSHSSLTFTLYEKSSGKSTEKAVSSVYLSWSDLTPWKAVSRTLPFTKTKQLHILLQFGPMQVMETTPLITELPEARLSFERISYYPGERIQGVLTLNIRKARMVRGVQLSFDGFNYVDWYDETHDAFYTGKDVYFSKQQMVLGTRPPEYVVPRSREARQAIGEDKLYYTEELYNVGISDALGEGVELKSGIQHFPFQFVLPMNLPPSISHMDGTIGIFYFVEGRIFEADGSVETFSRQLMNVVPTKAVVPREVLHPHHTMAAQVYPISKASIGNAGDNYSHSMSPDSHLDANFEFGTAGASSSWSSLEFEEYHEEHHVDDDDDFDPRATPKKKAKQEKKQGRPVTTSFHPVQSNNTGLDDVSLDDSDDGLLSEGGTTPGSEKDEPLKSSKPGLLRTLSKTLISKSPISVHALLPSVAVIGHKLVFQATIENRSNKPINSVRVMLRSVLHLSGYRNGQVFRKLHEYTSPKGNVCQISDKNLPEFPLQPGHAWKGELEIQIPKNLHTSIQARHMNLAYEVKIEAKSSSRLLSGNLLSTSWNHVLNSWSQTITLVSTTPDAEVSLLTQPTKPAGTPGDIMRGLVTDKLDAALIPLPIAADGNVPVTGYQFPGKTFATA